MADEAAPPKDEAAQGAEGAAPAEGAADEAAAAKAKKKKMVMIISAVVAVIGVAVAVGVVFFMGGDKKDAEHGEGEAAEAQVKVIDVPEFTLNMLADEGHAGGFMKVKLAMELAKPEDEAAVNALMARLQDDWGGYLRQMRVSDMKGSAALFRLKEGLLRRANQSLDPVVVKAVYIRELLVQ